MTTTNRDWETLIEELRLHNREYNTVLDSQADDEGQPRGRVTMHAKVRIMDSPRVGVVEISYAEVQVMIDILTEGRTHEENSADENRMPDLSRDHVRDTAYEDH